MGFEFFTFGGSQFWAMYSFIKSGESSATVFPKAIACSIPGTLSGIAELLRSAGKLLLII